MKVNPSLSLIVAWYYFIADFGFFLHENLCSLWKIPAGRDILHIEVALKFAIFSINLLVVL